MPPVPIGPYLDRLCRLRCRLSYAQQRIRDLEALLAEHGIAIPASVTEVPPPSHDCFAGESEDRDAASAMINHPTVIPVPGTDEED